KGQLSLELGNPLGPLHTDVLSRRARSVVDDRALRAIGGEQLPPMRDPDLRCAWPFHAAPSQA
ncbi:MAG: hypothetical protein M3Q48_10820, partial [Actinomycetota bacterium]|nr:hypothetical protein [Actinomycetota bacterium]